VLLCHQAFFINFTIPTVYMNVIHGTWIPENTQDFIQSGTFYLWVENDDVRSNIKIPLHPQHLPEKPCLEYLKNELALRGCEKIAVYF